MILRKSNFTREKSTNFSKRSKIYFQLLHRYIPPKYFQKLCFMIGTIDIRF